MDLRQIWKEKESEKEANSMMESLVDLAIGALKSGDAKSYTNEDDEKILSVIVRSEKYDLRDVINFPLEEHAKIAKMFNEKGITGFTVLEFASWNNALDVRFIIKE